VTSINEDGCFIYLTVYDEAMNEIGSEVYTFIKPTKVGNYFEICFR